MNEEEKEVLDCAKKIKEYCNGTPREDTCKKCFFFTEKYSDTMCILSGISPEDWTLDDIQEKKLTDKQKQLLSSLDKKWKYIAKDANDSIRLFAVKPYKTHAGFEEYSGESYYLLQEVFSKDMFNYLSFEDEEATLIADVLN